MAQPVEVAIVKKLDNLNKEMVNIRESTYAKGETPEPTEVTPEDIFAQMDALETDLLKIRYLRDKANHETLVAWSLDGAEPMTIAQAIARAKMMRARLIIYRDMAAKSANALSTRWSAENLTKVNYNPRDYVAKADQLERQVNALSIAIDTANIGVTIDFDASPYLEGLI